MANISDFVSIEMGQSPKGEHVNKKGVGLPLLNGPTEFGARHPYPTQFTSQVTREAKAGDLLFCVRGSTTGRMNWAEQRYAIGRGIAAIRHKSDLRLQPLVRAMIEFQLPTLLSAATGSTFPNVTAKMIGGLSYPNLNQNQQLKAAEMLGSLDDKIELNRRMNAVLEGMARAVFVDWFVDFGPTRRKMAGEADPVKILGRAICPEAQAQKTAALFPERLGQNGLPEGWEMGTLGELFDVTMGQSPPSSTYNEAENGLPFFQGRRDFSFRFPEKRVYCDSPTRVAPKDWTLLSVRAPVGDINRSVEECCVGRGVAAFCHKAGLLNYTYYQGLELKRELASYDTNGTVFGSINQKQFKSLEVVNAGLDITKSFDAFIGPLDNRIRLNTVENQTLADMRDLLLPKLMSGEIRLREAE